MPSATAFCAALLFAGAAAASEFPWKAGDTPPTAAGIALWDSEQHVLDVLGPPDKSGVWPAGDVLDYTEKGLEITVAKDGIVAEKVVTIRLSKPEAGAVGGLTVGDKASDAPLKWGAPLFGNAHGARYGVGDWQILIKLAPKDSVITQIMLTSMRWSGNAVPPPAIPHKTQ